MSKIIKFPIQSDDKKSEIQQRLNDAAECNCGHKLFYIYADKVMCYKCKTTYTLE